jgi:hypothetical protein
VQLYGVPSISKKLVKLGWPLAPHAFIYTLPSRHEYAYFGDEKFLLALSSNVQESILIVNIDINPGTNSIPGCTKGKIKHAARHTIINTMN